MAGKKLKKSASPLPPPATLAETADDSLVDDLLHELESRDVSAPGKQEANIVLSQVTMVQAQQSVLKKDGSSKARHLARLSRKAAERAEQYAPVDHAADAKLEEEARQEELIVNDVCDKFGLEMHEITPDGHCLFSAIADQLALLGLIPAASATYVTTRLASAQYMYTHEADFLPFLPSPEGEDGIGATTATGLMSHAQFSSYCATIRDTGAWGGEPEIQALSRAYKVPICVVQAAKPNIVTHAPDGASNVEFGDHNVVRISYHRRMYGLGEHYNSLRPKLTRTAKLVESVKQHLP